MKTTFRNSFARDLRQVRDASIRARIANAIASVDSAKTPDDIPNFKKLAGTTDCFRIRIGAWRIGIVIEGDAVEFVRVLRRRDLYRFFP